MAEEKNLQEAFKELRKEKKRKFVQSVDLIVNLHYYDVRKEALNTFLKVPHPSEKKICAFLTKKVKIVPCLTEDDFVKYKDKRDMKKLANSFDFFIATPSLMSKIASKFGRVFGPLGKMPSPQGGIIPKEDEATIKETVDKMKNLVRVRNKEASIKLTAGKENMSDKDLIENIEALLNGLEKNLPRGKENIKNAYVKLTMSKPIKFLDNNKIK
ncbi:MAG: hypothetical protein WC260_03735 [Candidatus Pacearchaeota archaeon]